MIDSNPNNAGGQAPTTTTGSAASSTQTTQPAQQMQMPGTMKLDANPAPTDTQQQAFKVADIIGEDGSFKEGWTSKFEGADSLGKYKNVDELVKGFVNANQLIGKKFDGVKKPGEGASEEEIKAWRSYIGVPDNVDGYQIPDEYKDDYDEASFKEFAAFAHKHNIPAETAQELLRYQDTLYRKNNEEFVRRVEEASKQAQEHFRKEWGPQYERNATILRQSLIDAGIDVDDSSFAMALNNPYILEALYEKAARYQEGTMPSPGVMRSQSGTSAQQRMIDMISKYGSLDRMPKDAREEYNRLASTHVQW